MTYQNLETLSLSFSVLKRGYFANLCCLKRTAYVRLGKCKSLFVRYLFSIATLTNCVNLVFSYKHLVVDQVFRC